jgi:hypothetical protein
MKSAGLIFGILFLWIGWRVTQMLSQDVLKPVMASNGVSYWVFDSKYVEKMAEVDNMLRLCLNSNVPNKHRYKGNQTLRQSKTESFTLNKNLIYLKLNSEDVNEMAVHELAHLLAISIGHTEEWHKIHETLFSLSK